MASSEVTAAIQSLEASSSSSANRSSEYSQLLDKILASPDSPSVAADLIAYVQSVLSDSLGIVASRPILSAFVQRFKEIQNAELQVEVGQRAVELLQPKVVSYEEQDFALKQIVASAQEKLEDFMAAARTLQAITLDSSQRTISDDEKANIWIRIVRNYLEEGETIAAGAYLNRVKGIIFSVSNPEIRLHFALSQARVNDAQRNFLDASQGYYTVSNEPLIDEAERLQALSAAMVCAVLAPAGPQRSRSLARLYKDERASQVDVFPILEKIFLDRILEASEVQSFSQNLAEHQVARTADGSTVLDRAVLDHNLLAASRLYRNVSFAALGELLNVDPDKAETYASQMIEQGRVAGYIDQIAQFIFFEGEGTGQKKTDHAEHVVGKELRTWDSNVLALSEVVERAAGLIQLHDPVSPQLTSLGHF
jgi:COP9 signalosome complex subunit 4